MSELIPTDEQTAIINFVAKGHGHLLIDALAGTGKTRSLLMALAKLPQRSALFCAFNKRIADELQTKVAAATPKGCGVHVKTFHAAGLAWLSQHFPRLQIDKNETENLINRVAGQSIDFRMRRCAVKLLRILKETSVDPSPSAAKVLALGHEYDLFDKMPSEQAIDLSVEVVRDAYLVGKDFANRDAIDFCDMVWGPVVCNLPPRTRYQAIFADEFQDISEPQLEMLRQLLVPQKGRLIAVGDPHQQIYDFRGSLGKVAWNMVREELKATTLPLTMTWRCPVSVVEQARQIVPALRPRTDAPKGSVMACLWTQMPERVKASAKGKGLHGEMSTFVLSRDNANLLDCALFLWSKRVEFQLNAGQELLDPLITILDKLDKTDRSSFVASINAWLTAELAKAEKANAAAYADQVEERAQMLTTAAEYAEPGEIAGLLRKIFQPSKSGVLLSTVHKVKGLEAETVFLLKQSYARHNSKRTCRTCAGTGQRNSSVRTTRPEPCRNCDGNGWWIMTPEPEELNIEYVAITRSKSNLVWVDLKKHEPLVVKTSAADPEMQLVNNMRETLGMEPVKSEAEQLVDQASTLIGGYTRTQAIAMALGSSKHHSDEPIDDYSEEP